MFEELDFFEKVMTITMGLFIIVFTIMMLTVCYQSFHPEKYNLKTNIIEIKDNK